MSRVNATFVRGCAALLLFTAARLAFAHAYPTHQVPGAGATVPVGVKEVAIDFDDGLEPAFSSIDVTDAAGKSVIAAKAVVSGADKRHMAVALNTLPPGDYAVAWVALASDGHRTQGHYHFTVK